MRHLGRHVRAMVWNLLPDPVLRRNRGLLDRHKGADLFLLGSGPSILGQDLTRLSGQCIMTQNHFHSHRDISIIRPRYHVVVPKYQPRQYDADWSAWLHTMQDRLAPETEYFFDCNTRYLIERESLFQGRVHYVRQGYNCFMVRRAPIDLTKPLMAVPTALPECLAVALYMGFRRIYLLGFDMNQIYLQSHNQDVRFYGKSHITANEAEEKLVASIAVTGLVWLNYWFIWQQCQMLLAEARRKGTEILNATPGSVLNMFPRVRYEDIIPKPR